MKIISILFVILFSINSYAIESNDNSSQKIFMKIIDAHEVSTIGCSGISCEVTTKCSYIQTAESLEDRFSCEINQGLLVNGEVAKELYKLIEESQIVALEKRECTEVNCILTAACAYNLTNETAESRFSCAIN